MVRHTAFDTFCIYGISKSVNYTLSVGFSLRQKICKPYRPEFFLLKESQVDLISVGLATAFHFKADVLQALFLGGETRRYIAPSNVVIDIILPVMY